MLAFFELGSLLKEYERGLLNLDISLKLMPIMLSSKGEQTVANLLPISQLRYRYGFDDYPRLAISRDPVHYGLGFSAKFDSRFPKGKIISGDTEPFIIDQDYFIDETNPTVAFSLTNNYSAGFVDKNRLFKGEDFFVDDLVKFVNDAVQQTRRIQKQASRTVYTDLFALDSVNFLEHETFYTTVESVNDYYMNLSVGLPIFYDK